MRSALTSIVVATLLGVAVPSGPAVAVPVAQREFDWVLKRIPDVKKGAKLYDTCAACHEADGRGASDGTVPAIGGQHFTVLAKQLVDFRGGWRTDPRMQHFSDVRFLAYSQDIADVATYISELPVPPRPKTAAPAEETSQGATLYVRSCERCHGAAGAGNADELVPRLAGQHPAYVIRQLEDTVAGRRKPMEEAHMKLLNKMSVDDRAVVAAFLASLGTAIP
jgi:cytochrome c553